MIGDSKAEWAGDQTPATAVAQPAGLRRDVTVWGSYMWGFADVGADTFVALGLVFAYAAGAAPLAFLLAGLVYILIGLAYTELAAAYPVAGGGQYFALRGLGDFGGFVSGSALVLDYTIDIALFAYFSSTYMDHFLPQLAGLSLSIGPFSQVKVGLALQTLLLIAFLAWLNVRGMRESSLFNEVIGVLVILTESLIICMGLIFAWSPELLARQWSETFAQFHGKQFVYGASLAIISFVGLESISQAAQETRRPATIVPRTSIALILTVFLFAISISVLTLGVVNWTVFQDESNVGKSVALVARHLPWIGPVAEGFTALLAALVLLISANSGVMSVSRVAFSMSKFHFISPWFEHVHRRFRTPARAILIFSAIGAIQVLLASLTPSAIDTLANMYAFGATLGYTLVMVSLIRLRLVDPYTPRPYRVPLNWKIQRGELTIYWPILGVIGLLGIGTVLIVVLYTHTIAAIAGPTWVIAGFVYYAWYRRKMRMPIFRSIRRDWEQEQQEVLTSAEEFDLLEQYRNALAARDKAQRRQANGR
ncbi:MAG: APC family permease [Acidobacteria bacterium]|nr:APC family permease [Acidobacteriota bacterium]